MILTDEQLVTQPVANSIPEWRTQVTGRFSDISGNRTVPMFSSVFRARFNPRRVMPMAAVAPMPVAVAKPALIPTDSSGAVLYRWSK